MHTVLHALATAGIFVLLPMLAAAVPVELRAEHCVVHVRSDDTLNLRAGPGTGHQILAELDHAQCGIIVTGTCTESWCPVEGGHHAGWVHRRHIAAVGAATNCVSSLARPQPVALRAWPSDGSRVLTRLSQRSCGIALLPYTTEGWQKVRQAGWDGWVRLSDLLFIDG